MGDARGADGWVPPDGGYGWVVLAACTFLNVLAAESFSDFGIFLMEFVAYFDQSKMLVSLVGAFQLAMCGFMGIVWGVLCHKYGCRPVVAAGSLLISLSYIISAFMPNIFVLYLTYGVLPGAGFGTFFLCASIHVQLYFEKRRALAMGITMTGLSIGGFVWPPLAEFLIQTFGWRGTLLIQAAIHFNGLVIAALLRPPYVRAAKKPKEIDNNQSLNGKAINLDKVEDSAGNKEERNSLKENDFSKEVINSDEANGKSVDPSATAAAKVDVLAVAQKERPLLEMIKLLKRPQFLLYCLAVYFVHQGHLGPFTFLPFRGVGLGEPKTKSAFLISLAATFNSAGRILFGALGDVFRHHRIHMYALSALFAGVITLISTSFESFILVAVYAAVWGSIGSCYIAMQFTVPVDIVGRGNIAKALGDLMVFMGFAYMTSYPLSGFLLDAVDDARTPFYMLGTMQIIGSIFAGVLIFIRSREGSSSDPEEKVNVADIIAA